MKIAGYLKTSLIEWPGKVSSVIFTQGCNFRCPFCHNADLVEDKIGRFSRIDEEQIFADLKERKRWVDAVVVTGGEPTLQEDLPKFLKSLKLLKLLTMLHTNGTRPEVINELIINGLTDYICMDVKGNFDEYQNFTNVKTRAAGIAFSPARSLAMAEHGGDARQMSNVKNSIELILKSGIEYEFRTTVVPGLHNLENLRKLAEQIKEIQSFKENNDSATLKLCNSETQPKWFLQQFRPINTFDKKYLKIKPFSKEEMEGFQKELQRIIPQTFLRGV